jgi:DNA-binding beta-propeller fold protein YncE
VLNKGGTGSIQGFRIARSGRLAPIAGGRHELSVTASAPFLHIPAPEQIKFDRLNSSLIVTYGGGHRFFVFPVDAQGAVGVPVISAAQQGLPFSVAITRHGQVLVADPATGSLGAYELDGYRQLTPLASPVPNGQRATCWVVSDGGEFAYTVNTGSGTLSGYHVARDGTLALVSADGVSYSLGATALPTDVTITRGGQYLYVLEGGVGRIAALGTDTTNGQLTLIGEFGQSLVPVLAGAQGMAVR